MLLGCIADDFTGATDLANNLVRGGMRTIQAIGVPRNPLDSDVDAVVVALKSRTIPAADAIAQSLAALRWLRDRGCRQIYFKYCSTFDSTPQGNIGPVTEALMAALGCDFTIACPAFPENARTVFNGYLFVGDVLLSESGMRDHPLTPMTDANLVRVLQAQSQVRVGHIGFATVRAGAEAIRTRVEALKAQGVRIAIVDAIADDDLMQIGAAVSDLPLVTGGSGVAIGLPQNFIATGRLGQTAEAAVLPRIEGHRAVISGSCSTATNAQVEAFVASGGAAFALDPLRIATEAEGAARALTWAIPKLGKAPVLIYSTADPARVSAVQARLGMEASSALIEATLARIARGLVDRGVRQLVVAGGETSGAVVKALAVEALRIGPQIDPGVPWTATVAADPILLALKSGNFGALDFFRRAFDMLEWPT